MSQGLELGPLSVLGFYFLYNIGRMPGFEPELNWVEMNEMTRTEDTVYLRQLVYRSAHAEEGEGRYHQRLL